MNSKQRLRSIVLILVLCLGALALFVATSPNVLKAQGANVISNGDFENGVNGWQCKNCNNSAGAPAYSGSASGQIVTTRSNSVGQLLQKNLSLAPNSDYTLSFYAKSPNGVTLKVSVLQGVKPRDNYGLRNKVVSISSNWQLYTIDFTTSGFNNPVNDGQLQFKFPRGSGHALSIDNVVLTSGSAPPPPSGGQTERRIYHFDDVVTASQYSGFVMDKTSQFLSQNWESPVNFADGTVYTRAKIISIPKNQPGMKLGWCFWQRDAQKNLLENCKGNDVPGVPGTVVTWSYKLNDMWKKGGKAVDFSQPRLKMGFIIRDAQNDPVSLKTSDNWGGNNPADWYPMRVEYTVVLVAAGKSFSGWQNYP